MIVDMNKGSIAIFALSIIGFGRLSFLYGRAWILGLEQS